MKKAYSEEKGRTRLCKEELETLKNPDGPVSRTTIETAIKLNGGPLALQHGDSFVDVFAPFQESEDLNFKVRSIDVQPTSFEVAARRTRELRHSPPPNLK